MISPSLSVLLPVFNCAEFLTECIDSLLSQTFQDFEIILIDDCSTDKTLEVAEKYSDKRILIYRKERQNGYTNSLNLGIQLARGEFIARMDGDDICLPTRFEKQIAFLRKNPTISLCGTSCYFSNGMVPFSHPQTHAGILAKLYFSCPFFHSTIMGRASLFQDNLYDEAYEPSEDYELWSRVAFSYQMANLRDPLLIYRIHEKQVSWQHRERQFRNADRVRSRLYETLGAQFKFEYKAPLGQSEAEFIVNSFLSYLGLLDTLLTNNIAKKVLDQNLLRMWATSSTTHRLAKLMANKQVDIKKKLQVLLLDVSVVQLLRAIVFVLKKPKSA